MTLKIGMVDVDLLARGTKHPNLAQLKMSAWCKARGHDVRLVYGDGIRDLGSYDALLVSKVFTFSADPERLRSRIEGRVGVLNLDVRAEVLKLESGASQGPVIMLGGTGYYPDGGRDLDPEIEHMMPDYHLYDEWVEHELATGGRTRQYYADYLDASIGFATRGCFRKCPFCVNRKYDGCRRHAHVEEFLDPSRPYINLWDDNVLACAEWEEVLDELIATGKPFRFRQGLDLRLIRQEHIDKLARVKYNGPFIFAFDHIEDSARIVSRLELWTRSISHRTMCYVLTAYDPRHTMDQSEDLRDRELRDISGTFERIRILLGFKVYPYVTKFEDYRISEYKGVYDQLARWCNQPAMLKRMSFRQFCELGNGGKVNASRASLRKLQRDAPGIVEQYADLKWPGVATEPMSATRQTSLEEWA